MNPIIKWPGGKRREIKYINISSFKNINKIVEPFFGGGAFSLFYIDKYEIVGSDIDVDLVHFYKSVKSKTFIDKMRALSIWWDANELLDNAPPIIKEYISLVKDNNKKTPKHIAYYAMRKHYNYLKLHNKYNTDRAVLFYMMRELSFSSMFRFNSIGEFNVPYGGFSYNKKSLQKKLDLILELNSKKITIKNRDFINTIQEYKEDKNALIFLDPPYDSVFTDYNSNSFNRKDQIRLRDSIVDIKAKVILIINKTDFIYDLYREIDSFNIIEFDKKYSVNFKNRNKQKVKHLLITNFEMEKVHE